MASSFAHSAMDALFRGMHEKIDTKEKCVEVNRGNDKSPRVCYLVLTVPLGERSTAELSGGALLHVVGDASSSSSKKLPCEVKKSFAISDADRTDTDATSGASIWFRGGGALHVSFESMIQRDVFLARMKQLEAKRKTAEDAPGLDFLLVNDASLSDLPTGAAAKRRGEKGDRRVLNTNEEALLLSTMDQFGSSLGNMKSFEADVSTRIGALELGAASKLIRDAPIWQELQHNISSILHQVEDMEARIDRYSAELLKRKGIIESIEHKTNSQRRTKENVKSVYERLRELEDRITLPSETEHVIYSLSRVETEIVSFLNDPFQLRHIITAIRRIEEVENSAGIEQEFPVAAVSERRRSFHEFRTTMASKVKLFAFAIIDIYKGDLLHDRWRYSRKNKIIWIPHTPVTSKLLQTGPVFATIAQCDPEGHLAVLRRYCSSMQPIYTKEIRSFFKVMKELVRKVGWQGGFMLGVEEDSHKLIRYLVEDGELSMMQPHAASPAATPAPVADSESTSANEALHVTLPGLGLAQRLLWTPPETHAAVFSAASAATDTSIVSTVASRIVGESGGGVLRPDLVMAMVLETVCDIVLCEENFLLEGLRCPVRGDAPYPLYHALCELFSGEVAVVLEPQSSNPASQKVVSVILLASELTNFCSFICSQCDRVYVVPILSMLETLLANGAVKKSVILPQLLADCRETISNGFLQFMADQMESIARCARRGAVGLLPCLKKLPALFHRLESCHSLLQKFNKTTYEKIVIELTRSVFVAVDAVSTGVASRDPSFIQESYAIQFIHHAFFCVAVSRCSTETQKILAQRTSDSSTKRDSYEVLYLTRYIFVETFPSFAPFIIAAEELAQTYSAVDLKHHKALAVTAVKEALSGLESELGHGIGKAAKIIKHHVTRGVQTNTTVEAFVKALLRTTWLHFAEMIVKKVAFTENLLVQLGYVPGLRCPFSVPEVQQVIAGVEAQESGGGD